MAITKLNEGKLVGNIAGYPELHAILASTDHNNIRVGTRAHAWNDDCDSMMEVVWGLAGEALFPGAMCVFAEDFSATAVDANNIGMCGVAIGNGGITGTIASGSYCWFAIWGQARVHSDDVAAGATLYIDASNPGGVDDAVVSGDRIYGAQAVEADVATASVYNTTTTKCMLSYPHVDDV